MNAGRPAQKSPIGYWKFDEGADNTCPGGVNDVCDSSEYGNDGVRAGPTWTNEGKFGKALEFDGTNYVKINVDSWIRNSSYITISGWYYHNSNTQGAPWGIMTNVPGAATSDGFWWHINYSGTTLYLRTEDNINGESGYTGTPFVSVGNWYYLTTVVGTNKFDVYVNGVLYKSWVPSNGFSWANINVDTAYLTLGYSYTASINGALDEVKIYNYALTEEEIKQEYNQGKVSVMGVVGGDGLGSTSSAGTAEYCVPGSSDSCDPPVAEWNFDEKAGDYAYDTSGNGNTGTLTNMEVVDWKSAGECHSGACLDFDGGDSNEYVGVGSTSILNLTGSATVSAWLKIPSSWSGSTYSSSVSKGANAGWDTDGWGLYAFSSDSIGIGMRNGVTTFARSFTNTIKDQWTYIVGTWDGSTVKIYQDGTLKTFTSQTISPPTTSTPLIIGRDSGSQYFGGSIDQVRIYDYARTPAQIAWDYNKGKPVAHWRFDEGQGTTLYDESDNNNDGTLNLGSLGQISAGSVKVSGTTAWYNGREGKQNYSLNFDGSDDYVDVVDPIDGSLDFGTNDFTISLWVKTTDTSGTVLSKSSGGIGYKYGLANGWGGTSIFWFEDGNNPGSDYTYVTTDITDGIWHHVVGIADHTKVNVQIYVDGVYDPGVGGADVSTAGSYNNDADLYIGYSDFNGQIDDAKVFNYALTEGQIKTEYNMGAARLGTGD